MKTFARLAALMLALCVVGCASTPQAHFYTLGTESASTGAAATQRQLSLGLGPIDMPQYLDRPQIVTRDGGNRLSVDEFNRWGGSLDEEIQRALGARLAARLGTERIYPYPSRIVASTDYRLALEIRTFDGRIGGDVELDLAWSLIDDRTADVLEVRRATYRRAVAQPGYGAYVAALGELLADFADDVAAAVDQTATTAKKNPPKDGG